MRILNRAGLSYEQFEAIEFELRDQRSLQDLLRWSQEQPEGTLIPGVISRFVVQDEFTHDLVVPWRDGLFIAYGTTCLGAITEISVWNHEPTADELLNARIAEGWEPTPSLLKEGEVILGHAACLAAKN